MSTRVRAIAPLAISIGVVAFLWSEFALNFSFHCAFGGLLSTPWPWVAISVWVTFACGALVGVASGALAALGRPRRETEAPAMARPGTA
jgi:hypothetical protein